MFKQESPNNNNMLKNAEASIVKETMERALLLLIKIMQWHPCLRAQKEEDTC
jgi:hypothetical protein